MNNEILTILQETNNHLRNLSPAWVPALLTLIGAIGGASVVGYWQLKSSKLNIDALKANKNLEIKSEVISKQRQQWMGEIRQSCKQFLSEYDLIISDLTKNKLTQEQHDTLYKGASEHANLMVLMLNSDKESQQQAIAAIVDIQAILGDAGSIPPKILQEEYDKMRDRLIRSLQDVFRLTWKQIKNLE